MKHTLSKTEDCLSIFRTYFCGCNTEFIYERSTKSQISSKFGWFGSLKTSLSTSRTHSVYTSYFILSDSLGISSSKVAPNDEIGFLENTLKLSWNLEQTADGN